MLFVLFVFFYVNACHIFFRNILLLNSSYSIKFILQNSRTEMKDHSNDSVGSKKFYYRFKSFSNPNLSFVICCDMRCKKGHLDTILKKLFSTDDPRNIELVYSRETGQPVSFQELRSHQIYFVTAKKRVGIIPKFFSYSPHIVD